jgi:hypothetical protein|tara:strand:+ start:627 stop:881 length:255 start_codon:yes stop_codon:yes gene_type:complete
MTTPSNKDLFKDIKVIDLTKEVVIKPAEVTANAIKRLKHPEMPKKAKGGSVKKKFPDLSGDGKVTKKDILMAKGIIKKKPKKKR